MSYDSYKVGNFLSMFVVELDRTGWTKYRYFKNIYDDIETELIDAGLV